MHVKHLSFLAPNKKGHVSAGPKGKRNNANPKAKSDCEMDVSVGACNVKFF